LQQGGADLLVRAGRPDRAVRAKRQIWVGKYVREAPAVSKRC